jgi:two-component system, NarL family, sensor histidine kinase EvgS
MRYLSIIFLMMVLSGEMSASVTNVSFTAEEQEYLKTKKEITMCVDPDWEPFEIIDGEGRHVGIAADLIALVSERLKTPIRLVRTATWQETLEKSKSGQCDILSFVNQTPEREKWLVFTQPLLSDPNVMITREEHPFIADAHGLDQERVVLPEGTAVLERMRKEYLNLRYIPVVSEADAMEMVSERRADMTVRSLIVAAYVIKKEGWFNLKIAGRIDGYENHLRIGVLKDKVILRDILDKGVQSITPIERETIINKHTGLVVQEGIDHRIVWWSLGTLLGLIALIALWNGTLRRKVRREVAKNLEIKERLFQKTKQAEIGNLIANISHQWREPLSRLSSINLLVMAKLKAGMSIEKEEILKYSKEAEETIDFMSQTMQNFLEFYKQSVLKTDFSVYESIEGALSIIETKIIDGGVHISIEGEDCILNGVKNEWMQVWLNLLNNSTQVLVERNISNPTVQISLSQDRILFCDNGGGMDLGVEYHGLGIPMCRDILGKYGASLTLYNGDDGLCAQIDLRA